MSRSYPTRPYVGVGAVIWRDDKFLLIQRGKPPREREWSLPGGAQHVGETVRETCLREIKEETGLTVEITGLLDVIDGIFKDGDGQVEHHYTLVDFTARWVSGDAKAADDVTDVRWVSLDDLGDYGLWEETERVIRKSATKDW